MRFQLCNSLVVDTKDDDRAEECMIWVGERAEVVIGLIPDALRGNADALPSHLANNGLHCNFVRRNGQLAGLVTHQVHNLLGLTLGLEVVILAPLQLMLHNILNDFFHFRGVETLVFSWFQPVGWQVSHALVSVICHCFFLDLVCLFMFLFLLLWIWMYSCCGESMI